MNNGETEQRRTQNIVGGSRTAKVVPVVAGMQRAADGLAGSIDNETDLSYCVCQMPKMHSIGQFEQLVLAATLKLREDAYGVSIHAKVTQLAAPKTVSLGAVYVTLDRLEDKGFVISWLSDPTPERGGRAKRCYRLEALGERVLQESAATIRRMHEVMTEAWGNRRWKPVRVR